MLVGKTIRTTYEHFFLPFKKSELTTLYVCSFSSLSEFKKQSRMLSFLLLPQQPARNKELPHQAEERYEEVTRKKREAEDKEKAAQRRQFETERQAREKVCSLKFPQKAPFFIILLSSFHLSFLVV